ncbi:hypothetical protein [Luteibacter yeojuensis]|uniref:Uncharacterized protein n=1 Tax=Luteibacter yeojuensis TaxID=345309 RepID=A0A0F3KZZ2_9GAMM|nr:hypothetical protein [Luteibacter yeojuensis]KJV36788.1 hypothetical protein VI08_03265 [Luteibacter yeojuensis]
MALASRPLALATLLTLPAIAAATEPPALHYTVTPVVEQGDLKALDVVLEGIAGPDGTLDVVLPGKQERLAANGGLSAGKDGHLVLSAKPGAPVALRYRRSGTAPFTNDPGIEPYVTAGWMQAPCSGLLAMPADGVARAITVTWHVPPRWRAITSLDAHHPTTRAEAGASACFLGRDVSEAKQPIGHGGALHVYTTDPAGSAAFTDLVAKSLSVVASAAGGTARDYAVYATPVQADGADIAGWSQPGFMSAVFARGARLSALAGPAINDYARMLAPTPVDPATAWYTQGLRSYLVASDLLSSHALGREDMAGYLDQIIANYGNSPFRRASNARIVSEWQSSPDLQAVPGERGILFGWLLDAQLRKATGGRACLADVLRTLAPSVSDPGVALAAAVKQAGGGDITPLYEKYIVRGELLQLPPGALGPCMVVSTETDPYGWQVQRVSARCTAATE